MSSQHQILRRRVVFGA